MSRIFCPAPECVNGKIILGIGDYGMPLYDICPYCEGNGWIEAPEPFEKLLDDTGPSATFDI